MSQLVGQIISIVTGTRTAGGEPTMPRRVNPPYFRLVMILLVVGTISGCTPPEPTAYAPGPLPEILTLLPRQTRVKCFDDPVLDRATMRLWSLPGTYIADTNSGILGHRGDEIGQTESCEPILVTEYYWDPYEAKYWVKIETNDLAGWISLDLISAE